MFGGDFGIGAGFDDLLPIFNGEFIAPGVGYEQAFGAVAAVGEDMRVAEHVEFFEDVFAEKFAGAPE